MDWVQNVGGTLADGMNVNYNVSEGDELVGKENFNLSHSSSVNVLENR